MVISGALGIRKPDPAIFARAAELTGQQLAGSWMIGDSAAADIAGGQAAGTSTVWLRRERAWPAGLPSPTASADSFGEAMDLVLA